MRIKKIICAVVSGVMLFSACAPVSAWDREYGTEEYEGSATAVSEDAEILREKKTRTMIRRCFTPCVRTARR